MSDEQIANELEADFKWIKENARRLLKKRLLKLISIGMASKEHVEDFEMQTPNNNLWLVTANIRHTKQKDVRIRACCIVESEYGTRDYLILRGTRWGGTFYVKVISHAISRMRERNKKFAHLSGGQVANRVFQPGETAQGIVTDGIDLSDVIIGVPDGEKIGFMFATSAGVFFGEQNRDKDKQLCHSKFVTYVTPEQLATHEQADMYRFLDATMQLEKHCYTKSYGKNAMSFMEDNDETRRLIKVLEEYKNAPFTVKGSVSIPE